MDTGIIKLGYLKDLSAKHSLKSASAKISLKMTLSTFLLILLIAKVSNADSTVQTTSGLVRGTTVASGKVEAFLGIPYAEPPVGPLRFSKPVPKTPWKRIYHANQLPPACIQTNRLEFFPSDATRMSEDCLYLNIWMPQSRDRSERKTIIIFIHGGGHMTGSGMEGFYDGTSLSEYGDVIVVTINYRLGGLGFFTGFIDDAPGNMGMHDQVVAIRWIKENAEVFQGDPDNIVIMGHSVGSLSVSEHLISPLSNSLFKRAILLSGSVFHPAFSDSNKRISVICQKYVNILGCSQNGETLENNPRGIVECMKNLPVEKFIDADGEIVTNLEKTPRDISSLQLYPRVGDDFLPENTIDSFRRGNFKDTEILIGITRNEGSALLAKFTPTLFGMFGEKIPFLNKTLTRQFIRNSIRSCDEKEDEKITQTYMDRVNEEKAYPYLKALRDAVGDYIISCSVMFQADIQSLRNNPIYFYIFDYLSASSDYPKWMGVPHGEDLYYVFGNFYLREYTEMDKVFSRNLMDRLVTFAKTGNPNVPNAVTWPRYTFEDPKYLVIGKRDTVKAKPDDYRCVDWRKSFGAIFSSDLFEGYTEIYGSLPDTPNLFPEIIT